MQSSPKLYNHIPDLLLVLSILLPFVLTFLFPQTVVLPWYARLLGVCVAVGALVGVFVVLANLKRQRTSTNPIDAPSQLIATGMYTFSRNPMYLAEVIVGLGCVLASGSWLALCVPLLHFVIIDRLIIPVEERQMKQVFGKHYTQYTQTVRRWV